MPDEDGELEVKIGATTISLPVDIFTEVTVKEPVSEDWVVILDPYNTDETGPFVYHRVSHRIDELARWYSHDDKWHVTWQAICERGKPVPLFARTETRARCPVCREIRSLKLNGAFKQHGSRHEDSACKGSGQYPDDSEDVPS